MTPLPPPNHGHFIDSFPYLYIITFLIFSLQDCGLQLTDEADKRCYPLEGRLYCHSCHIARLHARFPHETFYVDPLTFNIHNHAGGSNGEEGGETSGVPLYSAPPMQAGLSTMSPLIVGRIGGGGGDGAGQNGGGQISRGRENVSAVVVCTGEGGARTSGVPGPMYTGTDIGGGMPLYGDQHNLSAVSGSSALPSLLRSRGSVGSSHSSGGSQGSFQGSPVHTAPLGPHINPSQGHYNNIGGYHSLSNQSHHYTDSQAALGTSVKSLHRATPPPSIPSSSTSSGMPLVNGSSASSSAHSSPAHYGHNRSGNPAYQHLMQHSAQSSPAHSSINGVGRVGSPAYVGRDQECPPPYHQHHQYPGYHDNNTHKNYSPAPFRQAPPLPPPLSHRQLYTDVPADQSTPYPALGPPPPLPQRPLSHYAAAAISASSNHKKASTGAHPYHITDL